MCNNCKECTCNQKLRGFEVVADEFRKHEGEIKLPQKGTKTAMAYDFYSPIDLVIEPNQIGKIWTDVKAYMKSDEGLILNVRSSQGGKVKPDVVLYEEGLDNDVITGAVRVISQTDTLIIGGTSLVVYPAAGLINYFRGKNLVLINKSSTSADNKANLVIHDSIGKVLGEAVNNL